MIAWIRGGRWTCVIVIAVMLASTAWAQRTNLKRIGAAVSYVSSTTFYFDAGRVRGIAVGDTVTVFRKSEKRGTGVVTAISSSSSSASVLSVAGLLSAGDSVFVTKEVAVEEPLPAGVKSTGSSVASRFPSKPEPNQLSGRFALQYGAAGEFGKALDYNQPAAVVRLEVARLFGTGTTFTFYGRNHYDLSEQFARYGEGSRAKLRTYELSFVNDNPRNWFGWSVGRITSRFVGGLGAFDGGQAFIRKGNLSVGVLGGAQSDYSSTRIDPDQLKFSAFVNYAWGGDVFKTSDVTLAYGQQRYLGKIDRSFLYLQASLRFGTDLFYYSSTELDFYKTDNGVRRKEINLTNSFVTVTYTPNPWLSINAGYDAARTIYLFESMKAISDTLFDKTLKEGMRASLSFRLPLNITVTGQSNFRLASGTTSSARTLGSTLRVGDILGSEVNLGLQYSNIQGLYTEGDDYTVDIDRWIAQSLSISLRADRYNYSIRGQETKYVTTTAGGAINYRVTRALYAVVNFDQVWDTTRDTQRLYFELGLHF
jgi:hypothetical protein